MSGSTFFAVLLIIVGAALMYTGIRGTTQRVIGVLSK